MRKLGLILLCLGGFGFYRSSQQLSQLEPVPLGKSVQESLQYPAGKWELAEYASAGAAFIGALISMFPKGR